MSYPILDSETAPEAARPLLAKARQAYGFVPNILGVMAGAPALLEAYMSLSAIFDKTSFSPAERQVVLLAVSAENGCGYCTAAHSGIARNQKVSEAVLEAIGQGKRLPDEKLDALFEFTRHMVQTRGRPDEGRLQAFLDAGYSAAQVQEVILGIGMKTLSNYTNHIAETPLDAQFGG